MSWRKLTDLYPAVFDSIIAQGEGRPGWNCGCVRSRGGGDVWLCNYHEGLEDGITIAMEVQQ